VKRLSETNSIKLLIVFALIIAGLWPLSVYSNFFTTGYYLDITRLFFLIIICWLAMVNSAKYKRFKNKANTLQESLTVRDRQIAKLKDSAAIDCEKLRIDFQAKQKTAAEVIAVLEQKLLSVEALVASQVAVDTSADTATREYFDTRFQSEWQRAYRNQRLLSLLLIDIDDFSALNVQYGVDAGNELLQMVAAILAETIVRGSDVVAHFGGDQFVIILPETNIDGAGSVAEKLRDRVASAVMVNNDIEVSLTISIGGLSVLPAAPQSWKGAIIKLNDALNDAKTAGKNTVRFSSLTNLHAL
jgi:diguanylate cyclase (GGDEF)-like protein